MIIQYITVQTSCLNKLTQGGAGGIHNRYCCRGQDC